MIDPISTKYDRTRKNINPESSFRRWSFLVVAVLKTYNLFVTNAKMTDTNHAKDAAVL